MVAINNSNKKYEETYKTSLKDVIDTMSKWKYIQPYAYKMQITSV